MAVESKHILIQGDKKSLCPPDDYSTKNKKKDLNSFNHHDKVGRVRDNRWS
jgi:hypothetical protein